jgi:endo-1,4-beta-mannosidase
VLKLVNYYPSRHGWTLMWEQWDPTTIWSDFARIHAMGANAVRLILPAGTIGYPQPRPVMLGRIAQAVDFADRNGLRVELTLFDLWSGYADLTGSRTWASAVLGPFKGDPRVALVEIQNEVNPANQSAVSWARAMLGWTRTFARLPVTISAKGDIHSFDALVQALGTVRPDVYSFHFYASDASVAPATFYWAGRIAAPTPVFIGETGLSTADSQTATVDPTAEHAQDVFFQKVEGATAMLGLPPAAPWTLWDFAPGTLCACAPGYEYHFGLLRLDGSPKPAYTTIKRFFSTGLL